MKDYFTNLDYIPTDCLFQIIKGDKKPQNYSKIEFTNEIKPVDLYCYFFGKYGTPNGIQNILRGDHSDNMIQWEWAFTFELGIILIQGLNFRTEVHFLLEKPTDVDFKDLFISQIKGDFKNYGAEMKSIRTNLEKWTRFLNPFYRLNSIIKSNFDELEALDLDIIRDKQVVESHKHNLEDASDAMSHLLSKYNNAIGITFGIRAMLPILAESFINLIIFVLAKPEIKSNDRLFQNTIRQQIHIRIQSLHLNCIGFIKHIDYSSEVCKNFHSLINERNDLLHGNIELSQLTIGDVYFDDKIPIYISYEDFLEKAIGISLNLTKYDSILADYKTVLNFIDFILEHLDDTVKQNIQFMMNSFELGLNNLSKRLGVLFSDAIADFRVGPSESED